jgi:hypothetical protein
MLSRLVSVIGRRSGHLGALMAAPALNNSHAATTMKARILIVCPAASAYINREPGQQFVHVSTTFFANPHLAESTAQMSIGRRVRLDEVEDESAVIPD